MEPLLNKNENAAVDDYLDSFENQEPTKYNNKFLNSLENATEEDFVSTRRVPKDKKTKGKKRRGGISNAISTLFAVICFLIFIYCAYQIVLILKSYRESDNLYDGIAQDYLNALSGSKSGLVKSLGSDSLAFPMRNYADVLANGAKPYVPVVSAYEQKTGSLRFQQILVFLENLRSENSDTYGYIYIDGTKINFPVVQTTDNAYYLHRSFEHQNLKSGTIFADYRNSRTVEKNRNLVLYGHNLSNGGMFHHVTDMLKEENFFGKTIELTTFDGIYTFTPFSIYKTVDTGEYYQVYFGGDQNFIDWCIIEESRSMYHVDGISFNKDSVVLTLSTCISGTTNGRYSLHALLTEVER